MLPITRADGTRISHEDVVKQLEDDTVAYDITLGHGGYFQEMVRCSIKVETSQYATGIAWLRDLLYFSEYDVDRYLTMSHERSRSMLTRILCQVSGHCCEDTAGSP